MPEYTLSRSRRARYLRLQITVEHGLRVIAPERCTQRQISEFISRKQAWIDQHLDRIRPHREALIREKQTVPQRLPLRAIESDLVITIRNGAKGHKTPSCDIEENQVLLCTDNQAPEAIHSLLRSLVRQEAKKHLKNRLEVLSELHDLPFNRCTIRRQKTRWGSCSGKKTISLNDQLMFFPAGLSDHVLLHELAHTVHPHHGPEFYTLLRQIDPRCDLHREELRHAARYIPVWYQA